MTSATQIPLDTHPLHISIVASRPLPAPSLAQAVDSLLAENSSTIAPDVAFQLEVFGKSFKWLEEMGLGGLGPAAAGETDWESVGAGSPAQAQKKKRKKHMHGKMPFVDAPEGTEEMERGARRTSTGRTEDGAESAVETPAGKSNKDIDAKAEKKARKKAEKAARKEEEKRKEQGQGKGESRKAAKEAAEEPKPANGLEASEEPTKKDSERKKEKKRKRESVAGDEKGDVANSTAPEPDAAAVKKKKKT